MRSGKDIKWAAEQRFQFIEQQAFWCGGLNRSDLTAHFGLSVPQASKDIAAYQALHPDNLTYDPRKRRYFPSPQFEPGFITLDADEFLSAANGHITNIGLFGGSSKPLILAEGVPFPRREIDPYILQPIAQCAAENHSIEIKYVSMSTDKPNAMWRRVSPHAFGHDGFRWHIRAFCHNSRKFKDFLLSRCMATRQMDVAGVSPNSDKYWNSFFSVRFVPNPLLSIQQQQIIASEYGMVGGSLIINVRNAMLYYFNKRLRLDAAPLLDGPHESPLAVGNRDEFLAALTEPSK